MGAIEDVSILQGHGGFTSGICIWKILKNDNSLKNGVFRLPHGYKYYLWDILDTSELSDEDKLTVQKLRESKGIDPQIDETIKLRGFPVGDEALRLFMEYLEK